MSKTRSSNKSTDTTAAAAGASERSRAPASPQPAISAKTGAVVLTVLVASVWLWMQVFGTAALSASSRAVSPRHIPAPVEPVAAGSERFDPRRWYLPAEDMLGFVHIDAGPFTMGSDPERDPMAYENERWSSEQRQGRVDLPLYYLGRYEVTVAQFRAFVDATGYRFAREALQGDPEHPVTNVSWTDALAYANWLQGELEQWEDLPPRLAELFDANWRISLPSEAEWEKGARGDSDRLFPWGQNPNPDRANYNSTGPVAVGSIPCPECPYGLADMSGNVWELTRSPYQPYPYVATDDYEDLESESLWVMRGGAFNEPANNVRAAVRGGVDPGARRPNIGFRLALTRF